MKAILPLRVCADNIKLKNIRNDFLVCKLCKYFTIVWSLTLPSCACVGGNGGGTRNQNGGRRGNKATNSSDMNFINNSNHGAANSNGDASGNGGAGKN